MQREKGKVPTNTNKDMVAAGDQIKLSELRKILEERRRQGKAVLERPEKTSLSKESKIKEIIKAKQIEHGRDGHSH